MRPIVQSIKHYVYRTNATVASAVIVNGILVESVVAPATSAAYSVQEGSIVKAIYIEMWVLGAGASGTDTQFNATLEKVPAGATAMTYSQSVQLGSYPNKKNVLFTTQGVLGSQNDGSPQVAVMRGWYKIPKGKQRMGLGDKIVLNLSSTGQSIQYCGVQTYKEYR